MTRFKPAEDFLPDPPAWLADFIEEANFSWIIGVHWLTVRRKQRIKSAQLSDDFQHPVLRLPDEEWGWYNTSPSWMAFRTITGHVLLRVTQNQEHLYYAFRRLSHRSCWILTDSHELEENLAPFWYLHKLTRHR